MNIYPVVLAGGSGTRFWPVSRREHPKQLLPLIDDRSLLRTTVDRLKKLFEPEFIRVVTPPHLLENVQDILPELNQNSWIYEPAPRDTAPCIGLAAEHIRREDPDGAMLILPSDHAIADESVYLRTISSAVQVLQQHPAQLITFGITPDRAANGYGYIRRGDLVETRNEIPVHKVKSFTEKPDQERAESYVSSGDYLWNSGMFLWKATEILSRLQDHAPDVYSGLSSFFDTCSDLDDPAQAEETFENIPSTSIDFAVMEQADDVIVVESSFDWSDIGSWDALRDALPTDDRGNLTAGTTVLQDTSDSIVYNTENHHLVATVHVDQLAIIHTDDATLVCPLDEAQNVKNLIRNLKENGHEQYL